MKATSAARPLQVELAHGRCPSTAAPGAADSLARMGPDRRQRHTEAIDEYDSYAPYIVSLLTSGADEYKLAHYLRDVQRVSMGMSVVDDQLHQRVRVACWSWLRADQPSLRAVQLVQQLFAAALVALAFFSVLAGRQ